VSRVVVIGGGITGLTTALTLFHDNVDVELLEASDRLGGKILTTEVRGTPVDAGPDAFLVREAHMTDLCEQLNMTQDLVSPATGAAKLWLGGSLRPLPKRQYLGVPLDIDDLRASGLLTNAGVDRAAEDLTRPDNAPAADETAGSLIRRRLGDEVMDRLVGPLLGGINAGNADLLSLQAGVPQLAAAASHDASLMRSIPLHLQHQARDPRDPIFRTHPNGLGQVVDAMATRLQRRTHLGRPVERIEPTDGGWRIHAGDALDAEAVVLTTPAFATAGLIETIAPTAAEGLAGIDYASVVMVTLAFDTSDMPEFTGSGYLVPRSEGLLMTACSQASTKWAHLGEGATTYLRVSAGHADDRRALELDDAELLERLLEELRWVAGVDAEPVEARITRWPRSFPQYRPGHLERVAAIEADLAENTPGLFVAGAALRGLGLPACVYQGRRAAKAVSEFLAPGHTPGLD
jgi:oxygen-dependent protoporphyrinogen oxidase